MAQTIKLRRSSTSGAVPTTSSLSLGEVAINTYDGKMYIKKDDGSESVVEVGVNSTIAATTLTGNLSMGDNVRARFGTGNDLQIYHDGSHSRIKDTGTGNLILNTQAFRVNGADDSEGMIKANQDGNVELYYDGLKKIETTSTGVEVTGANGYVTIGAQNTSGFHIYTDRSRFYFNKRLSLIENILTSYDNNLQLQTQGATKLTLNSTGIAVTGSITASGTVDGVDIAARDAILTSTTTTAEAALPKAGGTMTGALTIAGGSSVADLYINNTSPTLGFTDSNSFSDNNDIYIVRGTSTGKLQFQFFDDSANTTTETFLIDQTGNATFSGSVTATNTILNTGSTTVSTILRGGDGNSKNLVFQKTTGSAQQAKISAVGDDLRFTTGTTTERMRINSSGNIGIGTTSPTARLDVRSPNGGVHSRGQLYLTNTDSHAINQGSQISLGGTYSGTGDTYLGSIAARKENATSGDYAGYLQFGTRPSGAANVERMRITSTGNVGIGTTAPGTPLDVQSNSSAEGIRVRGRSSDSIGQITLTNNSGNARSQLQWNDSFFNIKALAAIPMIFYTNSTERMRIQSSGNVGIGTTSPTAQLHVKSAGNGEIEVERTSGALINLQAQSAAGYIGTDSNHLFGLKANGTVRLKIATGGAISFNDAFTFPTADGSANQVLKTDGSGNMSWVTVAGVGNATIISDADNDTKIQVEESADEDKIRFDAAGVERFRIGSDIEVIAATDFNITGTNRRLNFTSGTGTVRTTGASNLNFGTSNTDRMTITSAGNVGIGTTAPGAKLSIHSSVGADPHTGDVSLELRDTGALAAENGGSIIFSGVYSGTSGYLGSGPYIKAYKLNATDGDYSYGLKFATRENGVGAQVVGLTIAPDQNVGIGTTVPTSKLHIMTASNGASTVGTASDELILENSADCGLTIRSGSSDDGVISFADADDHNVGQVYYSHSNNSMTFRTNDSTAMTVTSAGNVGIGTTAAAQKLHVVGSAIIDGGTGVASTGVLNVRQSGDTLNNGIALTSSHGTSHRIWKDSAGKLNFGPTSLPSAFVQDLTGNVGIGTTSPYYKLDTRFSNTNTTLSDGSSGNWGSNGIRIDNTNTTVGAMALAHFRVGDADWHIGNKRVGTDQADFIFANEGVTKMLIDHTGNVGIGTTSPSRKFEIHENTTNLTIGEKTGYTPSTYGPVFETNANALVLPAIAYLSGSQAYVSNNSSSLRLNGDNGIQFRYYDGSAGQEGMRLTNTGNVGIGTTAPNRKLHISGSGATVAVKVEATDGVQSSLDLKNSEGEFRLINDGGALSIYDQTDTAERFRIDTSGKVGIGTTTPYNKLHVNGTGRINSLMVGDASAANTPAVALHVKSSATNARIRIEDSDSSNDYWDFYVNQGDGLHFQEEGANRVTFKTGGNVGIGTTAPDAKLQVAYNGGHTSGNISLTHSALDIYNPLQANTDEKGAILTFSDHYQDTNGYPRTVRAAIKGGTDTVGNTADGFLAFYTDSGGANSASERMRISSVGNVGIGTTSPTSQLHLHKDAGTAYLKQTNTANGQTLEIGNAYSLYTGANGAHSAIASDEVLAFATADAERMRIDISGRLLLNATSTAFGDKLYVNGDAYVTGGWRTGTGATFVGELTNSSGILTLQSAANRDIQFGDSGTPAIMYIDTSTEYVGIGTTSPVQKFQVDGSIYSNGGEIYVNGNKGITAVGNLIFKANDGTNYFEGMRLTSTGNVGIGNSAPTSYSGYKVLHIGNATTSNTGLLKFGTGSTADGPELYAAGTSLRMNTSGSVNVLNLVGSNVGIGTTSPTQKLEVVGTVTATGLNVDVPDGGSAPATTAIIKIHGYEGRGAGIQIRDSVNSAASASNREWFVGSGYSGSHFNIGYAADGVQSSYTAQSKLIIAASTGNVGIGTSTPVAKLHVQGSLSNSTGNATSQVQMRDRAVFSIKPVTDNSGTLHFAQVDSGNSIGMQFTNSAANATWDLSLQPFAGNVGIGTTAPASKLHVRDGDLLIQKGTGTTSVSELGFTNAFDTAFLRSSYTNPSATTETYLAFHTNTSGATNGTVAEQMRIVGNKVAIGTTAPTEKLHIHGGGIYTTPVTYAGNQDHWALKIGASNNAGWDFAGIKLRVDSVGIPRMSLMGPGQAEAVSIVSSSVGIGTNAPKAKLQVEELGIDTTTTSTTAVTQVAIDSMVAATFRSARYTIQVTNSTDSTYHLTEMLLIHDGATPSINEFGTIFTGSAAEAAFTADINSGNVRILATPASTDAMAFKVVRHSITV